jgi:hypothetical protein
MLKKIAWEWEILDNINDGTGSSTTTARAKVIGGWIINHSFQKKATMSESMTFVPDRDHEWTIVKPFNPSDRGHCERKVNPSDFESAK